MANECSFAYGQCTLFSLFHTLFTVPTTLLDSSPLLSSPLSSTVTKFGDIKGQSNAATVQLNNIYTETWKTDKSRCGQDLIFEQLETPLHAKNKNLLFFCYMSKRKQLCQKHPPKSCLDNWTKPFSSPTLHTPSSSTMVDQDQKSQPNQPAASPPPPPP